MAGRRETESLKPIDKAFFGKASESPGRNESKRRGGLERSEIRRSNPRVQGEDRISRYRLTDAAVYSGGVVATAR